ncbi:MAG: flavodoxin family protein [Pseudomonadota bacterium]
MIEKNTAPQTPPMLALMGSPRRNGNTAALLANVLGAASEAGAASETVVLRDLKVSPCLEIYQCKRDGTCAIRDDMTPLYDKLASARVVILASPIFFYGPSAQAKIIIDRCQALWSRKYILGEKADRPRGRGVLVSVGATGGKKLFDGLLLTARYFFDVLNLDFSQSLLVRKVDLAGEVENHPEVMAEARRLGADLAAFILTENPE